jgi:hypothetical protein
MVMEYQETWQVEWQNKVKVKLPCTELTTETLRRIAGVEVELYSLLTSPLYGGFTPVETAASTDRKEGWVDHRSCLDTVAKIKKKNP